MTPSDQKLELIDQLFLQRCSLNDLFEYQFLMGNTIPSMLLASHDSLPHFQTQHFRQEKRVCPSEKVQDPQ